MDESTFSTEPLPEVEGLEKQLTETNEELSTNNQELPRRKSGISWIISVLAILSSTFLFALDNTVVADIQPKLILTFGEIDKLPWVAVAYGLGSMSVNLLWLVISCKSKRTDHL
jgi:hypothetical protein